MFAVHLSVGLRVALRAVTNAEEVAFREPLVDLLHAIDFVRLGALGKIGEEAAKIHPGGVTEYEGARGIVGFAELAEEGIEIVG